MKRPSRLRPDVIEGRKSWRGRTPCIPLVLISGPNCLAVARENECSDWTGCCIPSRTRAPLSLPILPHPVSLPSQPGFPLPGLVLTLLLISDESTRYPLFCFWPASCCVWPEFGERMIHALVRSCRTHIPPVENEAVIHKLPVFLWYECFKIL
jgi:hypothetical protein